MSYKVKDTVYAFPGRQFDCYSYLLLEDIKILIDPGTGFFFAELADALDNIGIPINSIDAIVNTHCHFDHIGANHLFDCPVYARSPDLQAISSKGSKMVLADMFNSEYIPVAAKEIPHNFHSWEVLNTPGHTPGSISLYSKKKQILISGDTLFPYGTGRTDLPGGDKNALKQSLQLLGSLNYKILLSGHGMRLPGE
ncbi:MAG: MBL fold metallo-hydrolase [Candidatus Diapherotrites archaeon]|nr:MBL fold metallo-hydrolase [Candidatus Diapherotrites archaeon]